MAPLTNFRGRAYAGGVSVHAQPVFVPYGPSHWAVLAFLTVVALGLVWLGRQLSEQSATAIARGFAVVILGFQIPMLAYAARPSHWNVADSLPLHVCDLAWMTAAYALWTRQPWAFALTYYWGLTLTPQAMLTPALDAPDFPNIEFIRFWGQHCLVVSAAVFLTWGLGMRPNWRSFRIAVTATLIWGVLIVGFNSLTGANYGFLNAKPSNPSLLDLMGGWPWYLGVELIVGLVAWWLVTWPWTRRRHPAETVTAPPRAG